MEAVVRLTVQAGARIGADDDFEHHRPRYRCRAVYRVAGHTEYRVVRGETARQGNTGPVRDVNLRFVERLPYHRREHSLVYLWQDHLVSFPQTCTCSTHTAKYCAAGE